MSRQFRYRVAALVLGGLLLGGPLVASGTASAGQLNLGHGRAGHGGRRVTFAGGGMFGRSCDSHPDTESMTVPAQSKVRLVNRTGHQASLRLDGATKGMLWNHDSTEVIFRRGTTVVTLTPTCSHGNDATPVLVTAQPTALATPDPTPNPPGGDSPASAEDPTGASEPSDAVRTDTFSAPTHSGRVTSGHGRPKIRRTHSPHSASAVTAQDRPAGGQRVRLKSKSKVKSGSGTAASAAPVIAGKPLGEKKGQAPAVREPDLDPPTTAAGPAAVSAPSTEIAAAEPVAAMEPMREQEPIGLLAVIAAVCALGVGIAAIRAFVSQRANRSRMT